MTLFQLLAEGIDKLQRAGNPDAAVDAQQLLLAAFHLDMVHFLLNRMQELPENQQNQAAIADYQEMVVRRSMRCPLQQILGSQEFMGMEFYVNEHVLIPRQDTETLVELVLEQNKDTKKTVLDLCTGTGCIAISLSAKGGYQDVVATDLSWEALKVAGRNVSNLIMKDQTVRYEQGIGCYEQTDGQDSSRIWLLQGDLWEALKAVLPGAPIPPARFDIITSNPPYIPTDVIRTLEPEVRDHEPILALDGTQDGLQYYRNIVSEGKNYLHEAGMLYLEIGYDQGKAVSGLLKDQGYRDIRVYKDLAGNDRVVCARN